MSHTSLTEKTFSLEWWKSWIFIILGSFLLSAGYVLFINPYYIVPGGVYGAGVVFHYIFQNIEVGTFGLMLDIPLLIITFLIFGGNFGTRTIGAALLTPLFMNTMTKLIGDVPSEMFGGRIDLSNEIILACVFGGILIGLGVGFVVRTQATTGGTDVLAMLVTKYVGIKFSNSILIVDSVVIIFGIIVIGDWLLPLYALTTLFVISKTISFVIDGESYDKLLFIISENNDIIRQFIIEDMRRGATSIKSHGVYSGKEKDMIFLVISRGELRSIQSKIKEVDPSAFVVVLNTTDTFGYGFKELPVIK